MSRSAPVSPTERLYRIVEDGMCIGCGLCQSVAGPARVRVTRVQTGYERPVVVGELDHDTVDRIYDVCPGTRLEGLPSRLVDDRTRQDPIWGPYRRLVLGHAADPQVRHRGSTGGVLSALAQFLLHSQRVAFILHVRAGRANPTFGEAHLSVTSGDVLDGAGSRYGPAAPLLDIETALSRGEPFAFVGKPCDVAALRNLARYDPRVDARLHYWLAPVCGGFMPPADMERFLRERQGVDPAAVSALRYRGFGCPGRTRYELASGEVGEARYTDMWGADETQWSLPFRCNVCPDGIGEGADVAAADTWPGGSPDPCIEDEDLGTNAVLIRTSAGLDLWDAAAAAGFVSESGEVGPRYMDGVQPHQVDKKRVVRARWDGLAAEGRTVPRSARLRLDALDAGLDPEVRAREFEGSRERARRGRADEPIPKPARATGRSSATGRGD